MKEVNLIKLTVSATPSANVLKGHWQRYNFKKRYLRELKGYELLALKEKKKAWLTFQRFGSRILDYDNYVAGHKQLIDCFKELGLIVDDRVEWCDMEFLPQVKCKRGEEKTVIVIEYDKEVKNKCR